MGGSSSKYNKDGGPQQHSATAEFESLSTQNIDSLRLHLTRLIIYAEMAAPERQREVAEKLANEAVRPERQVQIVEAGGLGLLLPLTKSTDIECVRLAAHALANLSVNAVNQKKMAVEGAIVMIIPLLDSLNPQTQRQAAKALANLGVEKQNKGAISAAGGLAPLIRLVSTGGTSLRIEAIAALANLAVCFAGPRYALTVYYIMTMQG